MTIQTIGPTSLRVIVESTFGADGTGSLGSYTYVPANEGSMEATITTDELDPMWMVQSRLEAREKILGKRSATLKFTMNLAPTGTVASSAVIAVTSCLGLLLKATMGAEHLGTGTLFSSGWTAITGDVSSAAGLLAGDFIGWANTSGVVEWRRIKALSSNTITLEHGFTGSPANTNVCYACATYSMTEDPATSLQFIVAGQNTVDRWLFTGGQCTGGFDISVDPSGAAIPTITFNMTFSGYLKSSETTGTITGTLPDATYSAYAPIVGNAGEFRVWTVGTPTTVTSTRIHVSALAFKPKIVFKPVTSPSGANAGAVLRYRATRALPPVEGSFTTFIEDLTWWTARDALADKAVQHTMGTAAGAAVILAAPTVQILNPQRATSGDENEGQAISFAGRRNTDTALTTELAKSPVVIALG